MLEAKNICKSYDNDTKENSLVLDNCNLIIHENEILGLMGESGCGKSSLAKILLKLMSMDKGELYFKGKNITNLKNNKLKFFRQKVQFISQRPETFFDPMMKLYTSLIEPLNIFNIKYDIITIENILEQVKLNPAILNRYPHQVSGGEIQRLSLARALLLNPELLILDEPTSMLDISVQAQILHLLKDLQKSKKMSYLFISHDKDVVNWLCDEVFIMENGQINK